MNFPLKIKPGKKKELRIHQSMEENPEARVIFLKNECQFRYCFLLNNANCLLSPLYSLSRDSYNFLCSFVTLSTLVLHPPPLKLFSENPHPLLFQTHEGPLFHFCCLKYLLPKSWEDPLDRLHVCWPYSPGMAKSGLLVPF